MQYPIVGLYQAMVAGGCRETQVIVHELKFNMSWM